MSSIHINDTDYDAEAVRAHREQIIQLRDHALEQTNFDWAVVLSITIGLLYELAEKLEND